ncbi:serine/threonine protein kinase [Actinoallomurus purpureus]|uniref:WD40 repeat domain-containing serine/threonine protein kinase n=1 Tax=Actinoallomurus purpureus TaxID=478114 RepID=UPI0020931E1F|nr:serine/threonine-protein kinase [Actinoallomurus purpureus]MCO6005984.1 serine/threonine protein kinase [Actinoallomurus purpureus]
MDPLQVGDPRQVGAYPLLGRLGGGGMGQVFVGRSRGGRLVAVKLVRPELADDRRFRLRFAEEVAAARRVGGFYTAPVVDADPDADPPWLVTAFIAGPSLQQAIEAHGPLPAQAVGVLGAGLAEGLAAIHNVGLVHRDLKPGNIILAADGPRVIDFGIARALDATHASTTVLGTPGFMSPEQASGLRVGPPSDVFALGSVLTFAATGYGPFGAGSAEAIVYRVVHHDPDLTRLPAHLTGLISGCLAKKPEERPGLTEILDRLALPAGKGGTWLPPAVTTMISECDREFSHQARAPRPDTRALTARSHGRQWRPSRRDFMVAGLGVASVAAIPAVSLLRSVGASGHPTPTPNATGHSEAPVTLLYGGNKMVRSVAFSPDGKMLAGVGDDGKARLWEVATGTLAKTFTHTVTNPWARPLAQVTAFNSQFSATMSAAFSPDGAGLAVGNGDGTISLWNVATGAVTTLPYLNPVEWNGSPGCVAFNPADGTLAAAYDAPAIRLWNPATRTSSATLHTGNGYWVAVLAFNPSGRILASASGNGNPGNTSSDGLLQLWDTSSHANIATLAHTNSSAHSLAFSPDGKTLANLRSDGTITLWDVTARTRIAGLTGPGSGVTCIAFGPDAVLATGFNDGTVTLWDVTRRKGITALSTGTDAAINCVAFSPNGRTVAIGGRNLTMWTIG